MRFIALLLVASAVSSVSVFVSTLNNDALFETSDPKKATDVAIIEKLATNMADQFSKSKVDLSNPVIMFHFQEVISCASKVNGAKMGFVQSTNEADFFKWNEKGKTNIFLNMYKFTSKFQTEVKAKSKIDVSCPRAYYYQAIGSIICFLATKLSSFTLDLYKTVQFGEKTDGGLFGTHLFQFGFKGAMILKVVSTDITDHPVLYSVNVHLSSRSLYARRRQLLKLFRQFLDTELEKKETRSAIFFMGGDFNTRSGSNFEGITDKNFMLGDNKVYLGMLPCIKAMESAAKTTPDLNSAMTLAVLDKKTLHSQKLTCGQMMEELMKFDEYQHWFSTDKEAFTKIAECFAKKPKNPEQLSFDRSYYSQVFENKVAFLPTFCFDKSGKKYGCHKQNELISYTDRVMYMLRVTVKDIGSKNFYTVTPTSYTAHSLDLISDHAGVFAGFNIAAAKDIPKWLDESQRRRLLKGGVNSQAVCEDMIEEVKTFASYSMTSANDLINPDTKVTTQEYNRQVALKSDEDDEYLDEEEIKAIQDAWAKIEAEGGGEKAKVGGAAINKI